MKSEQNWNTNGTIHAIPRLYVMVGCPGSGKSTWAKKHLPDTYYVSRDEVRFSLLQDGEDYFSHEKEVFNKFIELIKNALNHGDCIADASHLTKASRSKLFKALSDDDTKPFDVYYIFMDTPLAVCLKRNVQREGRARVPEDAICNMYAKLSMPTMNEYKYSKGIWIVRE